MEKKEPQEKQKTEEIKELKKLARETTKIRMKIRYDAIRHYLDGRTSYEIAKILDISYDSVRDYINAYKKSGITGLDIKKSPGRSRKLTEEQEQKLYECISARLPKDVGFEPFANWTATLACNWVYKEFGVQFSQRGMLDVFYRLKLSYTRPTYVLKKADPVKQEAFKVDFDNLKKIN